MSSSAKMRRKRRIREVMAASGLLFSMAEILAEADGVVAEELPVNVVSVGSSSSAVGDIRGAGDSEDNGDIVEAGSSSMMDGAVGGGHGGDGEEGDLRELSDEDLDEVDSDVEGLEDEEDVEPDDDDAPLRRLLLKLSCNDGLEV